MTVVSKIGEANAIKHPSCELRCWGWILPNMFLTLYNIPALCPMTLHETCVAACCCFTTNWDRKTPVKVRCCHIFLISCIIAYEVAAAFIMDIFTHCPNSGIPTVHHTYFIIVWTGLATLFNILWLGQRVFHYELLQCSIRRGWIGNSTKKAGIWISTMCDIMLWDEEDDIFRQHPRCLICKNDFSKVSHEALAAGRRAEIIRTPCGHPFHTECLSKWMCKMHKAENMDLCEECPICHKILLSYQPHNFQRQTGQADAPQEVEQIQDLAAQAKALGIPKAALVHLEAKRASQNGASPAAEVFGKPIPRAAG
eukprot:gnl/TRDRNA2_/TRDRNA2_82812_c0_seq1.p1 gnl/TRDRNA2_/TRDRNA2_82812_c0~~gnl/TRDRNA2_/TRDRNA2_82812_c0_seq1.p1  ORF type:complete len:311 (-),score=34.02 gnl/TRDRNA2_/TRDRNA2_82812_c0_seq1:114-1046(-)